MYPHAKQDYHGSRVFPGMAYHVPGKEKQVVLTVLQSNKEKEA
jgi:hypothetical protein